MFDVVVDNPPFSILQDICRWYMERGIKFFLFAPHLTAISTLRGVCTVVTDNEIVYHNGARVRTAFRTNLDPSAMRTAPALADAVSEAMKKTLAEKKSLPSYDYPPEICTVSRLAQCAKFGVDFSFGWDEAVQVRALDSMRAQGKAIFGNGYILNDEARDRLEEAREQARREQARREKEAYIWTLSERERAIIDQLNKKSGQ